MTPATIKADRKAAGLTQAQAARVCYVNLRTWCRWESGAFKMPRAAWELFTLRAYPRASGGTGST